MRDGEFEGLGVEAAFEKLGTTKKGLEEHDATRRISRFGYNEIEEKRRNYFLVLLSKFYGPVQFLLFLVIIISLALKSYNDVYIVIALIVFNSVVGFYEEYSADNAIEALKKKLSSTARVLRSGTWRVLPARLLVPGDIVRIRLGDIVPADSKIIECDYLESDESAITGESMPVVKDKSGILYQGSVIRKGEATCLVIRTGEKTLYGKTAESVESAKPRHRMSDDIMNVMKYLILADLVVVIFLFAYGTAIIHLNALGMLPFLLIVFLASVPVSLATAFTVSMALGAEKLASKSILVSKLDAIENTAIMDVICIDKTGTLTKNQMAVRQVVSFGCSSDDVIRYASGASREEDKDPIDIALLNYARQRKIGTGRQLSFTPFDASTKKTEAAVSYKGKKYRVIKGSVGIVAGASGLERVSNERLDGIVSGFAKKGFRSLAVAVNNGKGFRLVGIIALYDEPREDAGALIRELKGFGVETKMLTGDNVAVAKEISAELGIGREIIDIGSVSLAKKRILTKKVSSADGFANIYPEDKYMIVKALQQGHRITGMTGDGINDAPALKQAEVGIAVSSATDVAKSAAALVLTKSGIEVIISAVKESRRIFERMLTYTMTKISRVFQILIFVSVLFVALRGFVAITPFLLILLFFTNDIANISISTDIAWYSGKPDTWRIRSIVITSAIVGGILGIQALLLYPIAGYLGLATVQFQTAAFLLFNISDKLTIFNLRERRFVWSSAPSPILAGVSVASIIAGILLSYYGVLVAKISPTAILVVVGLSLLFVPIVEVAKVTTLRRLRIE